MALSKISRDMRLEDGRILQTLDAYAPTSGQVEFTSSAFTDIGLSVSITPSAASSKFLIIYTCPIFVIGSGAGGIGGGFRLYRGGTVIDDPQGDGGGALGNWLNLSFASGYWDFFWTHTGNLMDSPNTTSTVNYNVKYSHRAGTRSTIGYNSTNFGPKTRMTVMEIAS